MMMMMMMMMMMTMMTKMMMLMTTTMHYWLPAKSLRPRMDNLAAMHLLSTTKLQMMILMLLNEKLYLLFIFWL